MTLQSVTGHVSVTHQFACLTQGHASHYLLDRGSYIRDNGGLYRNPTPDSTPTHIGTHIPAKSVTSVTNRPPRKKSVFLSVTGHAFKRDRPWRPS